MTLKHVTDVSVADWFVDSDADWWSKVILGPPGYESYVRVLYDLDPEGPDEIDETVRQAVRAVLAEHTASPDECYFGLWEGNGSIEAASLRTVDLEARRYGPNIPHPAAYGPEVLNGPKVAVSENAITYRAFYLFFGPLEQMNQWGASNLTPDWPRDHMNGPNVMWPADHTWFMAADADPDWFGVGGSEALIADLLADTRFEAIRTTYGPHQPEYR
ncbi:hypothetical protein BH09ACT10_BH09ACT10_30980 [soil metagenome]